MGLFDGPVMSFATKFCKHLDKRVEELFKASEVEGIEPWQKMKNIIVGETLSEVSAGLKLIAGIDDKDSE